MLIGHSYQTGRIFRINITGAFYYHVFIQFMWVSIWLPLCLYLIYSRSSKILIISCLPNRHRQKAQTGIKPMGESSKFPKS